MKKKALIVVSVAATLALALTACGTTAPSGSSSAASASTAASGTEAAATETLTVEEMSLHLADGAAQAVVTVEPADLAGQLTYKTGDAAIATVDETGTVTAVAAGEVVITAETAYEIAGSVTITIG